MRKIKSKSSPKGNWQGHSWESFIYDRRYKNKIKQIDRSLDHECVPKAHVPKWHCQDGAFKKAPRWSLQEVGPSETTLGHIGLVILYRELGLPSPTLLCSSASWQWGEKFCVSAKMCCLRPKSKNSPSWTRPCKAVSQNKSLLFIKTGSGILLWI